MRKNIMKRWTILLIITGWLSTFSTAGTGDLANFNGRAVSLKVLQQKLEELHGTNSRPTNLYYLCGINRIMGYVVDEANQDIILVGKIDKKLPPLYLDDFVVALRNAWEKYTELKGNTRYYSNPGCSIDPDPKVYQKLGQVWKQTGDTGEAVRQWEKICQSPQQVRVLGIPFNTHFARVMVQADYDMKRLVDGSDELSIFAFNSLMEMEFEREKVRIRKGESRSAPVNNLNRFWFSPGEYRFLEDDNMVLIDQCTVELLTEEEHVNEEGSIVGAGHANPTAKQFARDFSGFYDDIAGERPVYRELENLFRFVALAKAMKLKAPHEKVGLRLEYLLERYQVTEENVERHLPGRNHVRKYEGRTIYDGGNQTFQLWMPSCGGVSMDLEVKPQHFKEEKSDSIENIKACATKGMVLKDRLFCNFSADTKEVHIVIKRKFRQADQNNSDCTLGEMYINGKYFGRTLELPYRMGKEDISSIPEGIYDACLRSRSKPDNPWRIQLKKPIEVPNPLNPGSDPITRDPIQIHHGTRPEHTRGCPLVAPGHPFSPKNATCNIGDFDKSREFYDKLLEKYFGSSQCPDTNTRITLTIQNDY